MIQWMLVTGSSAFTKSSLYIGKFSVHILLKLSLKDFEYHLAYIVKWVFWKWLRAPLFKNTRYKTLPEFQFYGVCVCVYIHRLCGKLIFLKNSHSDSSPWIISICNVTLKLLHQSQCPYSLTPTWPCDLFYSVEFGRIKCCSKSRLWEACMFLFVPFNFALLRIQRLIFWGVKDPMKKSPVALVRGILDHSIDSYNYQTCEQTQPISADLPIWPTTT